MKSQVINKKKMQQAREGDDAPEVLSEQVLYRHSILHFVCYYIYMYCFSFCCDFTIRLIDILYSFLTFFCFP